MNSTIPVLLSVLGLLEPAGAPHFFSFAQNLRCDMVSVKSKNIQLQHVILKSKYKEQDWNTNESCVIMVEVSEEDLK